MLLQTPKQDPESVEALSGDRRLLQNPIEELIEALSGTKSSVSSPKAEQVEALPGVKRLLRTPKQKPEQVEALSGVKTLLQTPKQDPESVEALSGDRRLLQNPMEELIEALSGTKSSVHSPKAEQVEALSGVKRLLRTPKQKPEQVEALSGVKRLLRTPKQKPELIEALSGVKRLLRTPKQDPESVEALSGDRRLLPKVELIEALLGAKSSVESPKTEQVEVLSGAQSPLKTPKAEQEEALSGVKRLLKTFSHKAEPANDAICSKPLNSPEELFGLNATKEQEEKIGLVEDMEGIQRLLRTPKQKFEPVKDMIGISRILKTPKQKFIPVNDYFGLQRLMAEPKQNSLNDEIDYTGVKELLEPVDGHLDKLSESVKKPDEISSNEFGCREDDPEREESCKETGLEDSFIKRSPNIVPRSLDDGHDELQDYLGHSSCSSLNDVKREDVQSTVTVQLVAEKNKSDEMIFQSGAATDLIDKLSARQGESEEINAEISKPLTTVKKPRKEKAGKSSFTEEHDIAKTGRQTRSSKRAKLANCMQTNENFEKNVPETSQPKGSESYVPALNNETTEVLIKKSIETSGNMDLDNIKCSQETLGLSKEMITETQVSVNRRRDVAKLNRKADESLHLEENVANQENADEFTSETSLRFRNQKNKDETKSEFTKRNPDEKLESLYLETSKRNSGNQVQKKNTRGRKATSIDKETGGTDGEKHISKTSLRSRNKNNDKPKSEFTKTDPQEKMQSSDLETSKGTNELLKKNTRRRKATLVETEMEAVYGEEHTSPKICKLETLENHPSEMKDDAIRKGKRRKVRFLLDNGTSETLEVKCEEDYNAFSERNTSPIKENTSQKNKKEAPSVVSPSLCTWFPLEKQALAEISKDRENFTLANKDPASFGQGGCLQEINFDKNWNESQVVPLEDMQTSVGHSAPKRQKVVVAKKNPPRRGRSKAVSPEPPTENGSTVTPKTEKESMSVENAIFSKENHSKRGRGKKAAPVSQTLGNPEGNQLTGSSGLAQGGYLQDTQNEKDFNELQKVKATVEHILPKRQKVTRGNLLQNGEGKQGVSHEPAMENDKENPDVGNRDMVVEDASTVNENQPKRGRRRKIASVTQTRVNLTVPKENVSTDSFNFAQERCMHDTQNEKNSNETQKVVLDNIESSVEYILPKRQKLTRSRSKQIVSDGSTGKDNKETADVVNNDMVVNNAFAVKENHPKRGRGRKAAAVPQILENDNFPLSSTDKSGAEEQAEALEVATTANQNLSCRSRFRNTLTTNSVPAGKKPRVADNVNREEMALKEITKENVSKRSKRKLPVYEVSTETNIQQRATCSKPAGVKGKKESTDSLFENQSKRSRGKNTVLALQAPTSPALKRSIILPSPSVKNETATENQNVMENNIAGSENLARNGRRNKEIVPRSTSVRRKCRLPEEDEYREKQNVNMEKTGASNDKQTRRAMKKTASKTTHFKETCGLPESSDGTPKDQQVLMANTLSGMEDASQGRRKRILKGKNLTEQSDQKNNNQKNTLPHTNENPSKRGRRKQVINEPEMLSTISGKKKCLFAENITSAPEAESTGSTLQRGRRKKIKEEQIESAVEVQTKMKSSRRTRKQVL